MNGEYIHLDRQSASRDGYVPDPELKIVSCVRKLIMKEGGLSAKSILYFVDLPY